MESIFEKRLTVTPDYCDASGALSPLAAFTIFRASQRSTRRCWASAAARWRKG